MQVQDTLQFYGSGFQNKVLALLMKDRAFLQQVHDIIDPKFFSSDSGQWIARTVLQYFDQYKSPPTLEVLKVKLDEIDVDVLKTTIVENIREILKFADAEDSEFIRDKTLDFCKNQKLKGAILKSVELLQSGKYDEIKRVLMKL